MGFLEIAHPYSFKAVCLIRSGWSPSVVKRSALRTVFSVTPNRLANFGITPFSYKIFAL